MAFYSVSDHRHFPGLVALINSIRLLGHEEPIFVVDAGLESEQRELVSQEATVIGAPAGVPLVFLRPVGPLTYPADIAIILDADIIVVATLTELIAAARTGRMIAFVDNEPHHDRFFPEWESRLELGRLRRQPYCNAGQTVVPRSLNDKLLRRWNECLAKIDVERTWHKNGKLSDPFYFGDQDVLNALAASVLDDDETIALDHRLAPYPPFTGLKLVDENRLICRYDDGTQPFVLHHILGKPWLQATRRSIYTLLLSRLLLAPDVALRLEPAQVPLRLRNGHLPAADRLRAHAQASIVAQTRHQLGRFGVRTRLAARRQVNPARQL